MHPLPSFDSESRSSAQELADDLWNDITAEREALLAENKDLKSRNFTLQNRVRTLEGEVERMKKREEGRERGGGGRGESSWNSGSRPIAGLPSHSTAVSSFALSSPSFFPSSQSPRSSATKILPPPPPSDLDLFPNEILTEILHHLHQPFHFYHYSNALLGIADLPSGSKPWNPVGLQLVCRRWRHIARPLFYQQVAFDTRDQVTLKLARSATEMDHYHPIRKSQRVVWVDIDGLSHTSDVVNVFLKVKAKARLVALVDCYSSLLHVGTSFSEIVLVLWKFTQKEVAEVFSFLSFFFDGKDKSFSHPNHHLTLRLPLHNLSPFLSSISTQFGGITNVPRFQLDFPFDLTPSLLETIFATLTSILQHPSLPEGRDYIFEHSGNTKKIIFGTHSEKDALVLGGKIEELGELEVVVEVIVLEL